MIILTHLIFMNYIVNYMGLLGTNTHVISGISGNNERMTYGY